MSFFVEQNPWVFLILTCILGGSAAFMAGRNVAQGWKSPALLFVYMLVFGAGLRFLHYALFQANLTSSDYYISQTLVVMAFAFLGFRLTQVKLMTEKYPWLFEKSGPLAWRKKP
jgi:hypothetical protein